MRTVMTAAIAGLAMMAGCGREQGRYVVAEDQLKPVAGENHVVDLGGGVGLGLVWVAPDSFQMGAQDGFDREKPVRTVQITQGYWMGRTEVTQEQWRSIMGDDPSNFKGDDLPVESVSWDRSVEFCRKLTDRERRADRLPEGYVYRLPTEAEWEYAARGGARGRNTQYAGSDDIDAVAWHEGNSRRFLRPRKSRRVGTKAANELGLHDMSGNVWEWVHDWYQDSYTGLSKTDPIGPANGLERIRRGGSWAVNATDCLVWTRGGSRPSFTFDSLGFRVVLAPLP